MNAIYTISQVAHQADVPTSTVRYYERRGLLTPERRSKGNYRLYGTQALERLCFVRSAQAAGFTLSDIGGLLALRDNQESPNKEVQTLIAARIDHVAEQMKHLQHVDNELRRWLQVCHVTARSGRCGVLERLGAETKDCSKTQKAT